MDSEKKEKLITFLMKIYKEFDSPKISVKVKVFLAGIALLLSVLITLLKNVIF